MKKSCKLYAAYVQYDGTENGKYRVYGDKIYIAAKSQKSAMKKVAAFYEDPYNETDPMIIIEEVGGDNGIAVEVDRSFELGKLMETNPAFAAFATDYICTNKELMDKWASEQSRYETLYR